MHHRQHDPTDLPNSFMSAAFSGMLLSLSLIIAIGPQNAHVLRMGLSRSHVWLTVAACAITDVVLIAIGVAGLASLGSLSIATQNVLVGGAVMFLLAYGWSAARRAFANGDGPIGASNGISGGTQAKQKMTAWQALGTALAFSWLNPHAWLDTAVLIGGASLAYSAPNNWAFGAGAALGSALWFLALGLGAGLLANKLARPSVWRGIDAMVAITMWSTAAWLAQGVWVRVA